MKAGMLWSNMLQRERLVVTLGRCMHHVSSVLVCVLCVALFPSVWGEFMFLHFSLNRLLDSQRQCSGQVLASAIPAPVARMACSAVRLLVFEKSKSFPLVSADVCNSHWDINGDFQQAQQCGSAYCCGSCSWRSCCSEKKKRLTSEEQEDCPQRSDPCCSFLFFTRDCFN